MTTIGHMNKNIRVTKALIIIAIIKHTVKEYTYNNILFLLYKYTYSH